MQIEVIIPCVKYSDFLAISLPESRRRFSRVTVLTDPRDEETIALAQREGVSLQLTTAWNEDGATFNKAAAINFALDALAVDGTDTWILLLDADIVLNSDLVKDVEALDPKCLYSVQRRMCETMSEWQELVAGRITLHDLPIYLPAVVNGKVWKHRPTSNPAGLCGYLQLWHITESAGVKRMPTSPNAASYDVEFAFSFPEEGRKFLRGHEVLHLGPRNTNWDGRVSPRWCPPSSARPVDGA